MWAAFVIVQLGFRFGMSFIDEQYMFKNSLVEMTLEEKLEAVFTNSLVEMNLKQMLNAIFAILLIWVHLACFITPLVVLRNIVFPFWLINHFKVFELFLTALTMFGIAFMIPLLSKYYGWYPNMWWRTIKTKAVEHKWKCLMIYFAYLLCVPSSKALFINGSSNSLEVFLFWSLIGHPASFALLLVLIPMQVVKNVLSSPWLLCSGGDGIIDLYFTIHVLFIYWFLAGRPSWNSLKNKASTFISELMVPKEEMN